MRSAAKWWISMILTVSMICVLAACGSGGANSGQTSQASGASAAQTADASDSGAQSSEAAAQSAETAQNAEASGASGAAVQAPGSSAGKYYSFDNADFAVKIPADIQLEEYDKDSFIGRNDKTIVAFSKWFAVSDPDIASLAELVKQQSGEDTEIVELGGREAVKVKRADGIPTYFVLSPDGDAYYLEVYPNTDADPNLTPADLAEEADAIVASMCSCANIPAGETATSVTPAERPATDFTVLANKLNPLPESWVENLDKVTATNSRGELVQAERNTYKAFLGLKNDLAKDGIYIDLGSGLPLEEDQENSKDTDYQTGLALDLYLNVDGEDIFLDEDMMKHPDIWEKVHEKLADHGFIMSSPKGKEHITGRSYEPWHIRYVGVGKAKEIEAMGGTLESYLGVAKDSEVNIDYGTSSLYSPEELENVANLIKLRFADWGGCELLSLRYAGDECNSAENLKWLNAMDKDAGYTKVIEFLADFHTGNNDALVFDPDTDYKDYQWWAVQTRDGSWKIAQQGY